MKQTTIRLANVDREAIAKIREVYGLESDSTAIRFALRLLADKGATLNVSYKGTQDTTQSKSKD